MGEPPAVPTAYSVAPDGTGGFYFAYGDLRANPGLLYPQLLDYFDIYLERITADGKVAAGFPISGLPICTVPGLQWYPRVVGDGTGGAYVAWGPSGGQGNGIHAQHVLGDGSIAPGWPANGKQMFGPDSYGDLPAVASDGEGGLFVAASVVQGSDPGLNYHALVQHVNGAGEFDAPWSGPGYRVDTLDVNQQEPWLVNSEPGAAIVAWLRDLPIPGGEYAQKVVVGGVVATSVALVSSESTPSQVALVWDAGVLRVREATVERRAQGASGWSALAVVEPDGTGRLAYVDHGVNAGATYTYRLSWNEASGARHSSESTIVVPLAYRFALAGATPNPAHRGQLAVAFTLERSERASLELFDVTGRRVAAREVGALGPGNHALRLDEGAAAHAGIYWLRLTQGAQHATARVVVVD